jgi:4,5-dihydroxyphthalate decarboxylase
VPAPEAAPVRVLRAAIGTYAHTRPLKSGEITSDRLRLEFADISPINRAFAPMVREQRFDVCEMAIATFLQAKAYGKPLVLLPGKLADEPERYQQKNWLRASAVWVGASSGKK